ncbi:MAG: hypothetical protein IKD06_04915 [Clostridia bacterium]|nr:hypothetical protein [Clostridia bacterium]
MLGKHCPRCGAWIEEEVCCPLCGETLTYENAVEMKKERLPFNAHTRWFWIKTCGLSAAVLLICLIAASCNGTLPKLGWLPALLSLWLGWQERALIRALMWKYTPSYAKFSLLILRIFLSAASLLLCLFLR